MIAISATRFRTIRRRLGHSQAQIARWFGVTIGTVNRWENEKTPIPFAAKVLLYFLDQEAKGNKNVIRDFIAEEIKKK